MLLSLSRPPTTSSASCEWSKPKARRHYPAVRFPPSTARIFIINALLWITTTIALGSITTAAAVVNAAAQSSHSALHGQSNYRGVDAVSALTGLSNGYMQSYYHQLRNAAEHQPHPHLQQHSHPHQTQYHLQYHPYNTELVDKEPTGRGLQLHANYYGNGLGGGGGLANVGSTAAATTSEALDIFNVPDSGFIPTTLSAAGQHYASSFLGLQAQADKTNAHVPGATTANASAFNNNNNFDLHQSAPVSYSNIATTTTALSADNTGAHSLYGRLSNYDELSGRNVRSGNAIASSGVAGDDEGSSGMHNFALAYDNYAVNPYNDQNTNEGEQQQNFVNYFTPTKTSAPAATATSSSMTAYGIQSPHKYLPLTNYHSNEQQQHQQQQYQQQHHHQQQSEKQQIYSRAAVAASATTPASSTEFYDNSNHPNNIDGNKQIVSSSYQAWNVMDKPTLDKYYGMQQQLQQYSQRQFKEDHHRDYKEPETSESKFVVHTSGKRGKGKSKRSDPLHESYETYTQEHTDIEHTAENDAETIQLQQDQLDELHEKLRHQQQQFVTLQHQLIDHDQQLQIQKLQPHYQVHPPTLPPVTHTIQHNPLSLHALSGTPLSKHTHVVRTIPVPQRQQVYVPTKQNVNVEVPDPVITTVAKPLPIEIPVSRTVAVPQVNEVKIPIEKVKPFPVERPIPYIVEKRVPYAVEKQVAKPVYYHVPIKVPIVHTVVHKLHTAHPYTYYHHQKQQHPIHYTGHVRQATQHGGGYGHHSHLGGGHYLK